MAFEIERRFLVKPDFDPSQDAHKAVLVWQSYLPDTGSWTVRARRIAEVGKEFEHYLTLKQHVGGATNIEIETKIDEQAYLDICRQTKSVLHKVRYYINHCSHVWEVDVYGEEHPDFQTICEVELNDEKEELIIPNWVMREVTDDRSFSNAALAERLTKS